ncbi:hypothetical protein BDA96_10G232600 [Sorghum bicolor]|uniref:Uncharacterized protein n=2 Tax=Sorghum bicolor TaxID=4558 RepID=A0A921Q6R9_SORBI|nr:probable pathogenesis-related protein ARB_02861 isoform X2 [Sorghum bicolor]KAG0514896.1 hypothetical protein BDA96_10G232600 [Sorghum bicolor]KXG20258.1 hypothetical protein SORBI_3010G176600 [Sorghum bicolor]|eukprot:XP_021305821.1 probable pathogenesis-related protein ARB_02861 isoform X2 [Sorghum bicolor]
MALRLGLRQPPLSCNLVLCIERMAFASSPIANPPTAPSNNDAPADAATSPPAPPPAEAPTTPCPGDGTGTHAPEVPPADRSHIGPPITHGYYTPTHQPHDP